jgi:hypothetical protein
MLNGRRRRTAAAKKAGANRLVAGARLTFRAEVMPGKDAVERTFEVARVLLGGRIELTNLTGQHSMTEFEPLP